MIATNRRRLLRRMRSEAGFTLPELFIVTIILAVITIPLANVIISYFTNTSTTLGRVSESHDQQQAAAFFSEDASNLGARDSSSNAAQSVWTKSPGTGFSGAATCAPGGDDKLMQLQWTDYTWNSNTQTQTTTQYTAAYTTRVVGSQTQLHRVYCQGGTVLTESVVSDSVLAHDINPTGSFTYTCMDATLANTPCLTDGSRPYGVKLIVPIKDPSGSGQPYGLTLVGTRRQSAS